MDICDFTSADLLLGLDLVAGWQLDKIKEQSLWAGWLADEKMAAIERYFLTGNLDDLTTSGFGEGIKRASLHYEWRDWNPYKHEGRKPLLKMQYELEWTDAGCNLLFYLGSGEHRGIHGMPIDYVRDLTYCGEFNCNKMSIREHVSNSFHVDLRAYTESTPQKHYSSGNCGRICSGQDITAFTCVLRVRMVQLKTTPQSLPFPMPNPLHHTLYTRRAFQSSADPIQLKFSIPSTSSMYTPRTGKGPANKLYLIWVVIGSENRSNTWRSTYETGRMGGSRGLDR